LRTFHTILLRVKQTPGLTNRRQRLHYTPHTNMHTQTRFQHFNDHYIGSSVLANVPQMSPRKPSGNCWSSFFLQAAQCPTQWV